MKKIILLLLVSITLFACNPANNNEINRSISVAFLGFLQLINLVLVGLPALILSIVAATNGNKVVQVVGIVFLSLFGLLALWGFTEIQLIGPRKNDVYFIFAIEFVFIVVSIVCVTISVRTKKITPDSDLDILDEI